MKKNMFMIVLALALIGIGFVLGCGSATTVTGNETSITTEEIRAERVFADVVYLMKDNGEPGGIIAADDDGGGIIFLSEDERFEISLSIEKDGPAIAMRNDEDYIRMRIIDGAPMIGLYCENEPLVILGADSDMGGGIIFTIDEDGNTTGTMPQQ